MKRLMLTAALALAAAAGPAAAQSSDPVDAAEYLLGAVCFPLFDGQAVTPERLAQVAGGEGLVEREGRWLARLGDDQGLVVDWNPGNETCRITAFGTPAIADGLIVRMQASGWRGAQHRQPLEEGGIVDILCARAPDNAHDVCALVHRLEPLEADRPAMTVTMIRMPEGDGGATTD